MPDNMIEPDHQEVRALGRKQGKAENTLAVCTAEAEVIQKKSTAVGQANYALIEVGRALAEAKIPLVPQITVGGGSDAGNGSLVNVLLANLVAKNLDAERQGAPGSASTL